MTKINYQETGAITVYPIDESLPTLEVTDEQLSLIKQGKMVVKNGILVSNEYNLHQEYLREQRKKLLNAFDIYKQNVTYGILKETEQEHLEILSWYNAILNLDENAINNVPVKIKQYL